MVSSRVHAWTSQRVRDVPHACHVEVVVRKTAVGVCCSAITSSLRWPLGKSNQVMLLAFANVWTQLGNEITVQTAGPDRLDHEPPTRLADRRQPTRVDAEAWIPPGNLLHVKRCPLPWSDESLEHIHPTWSGAPFS